MTDRNMIENNRLISVLLNSHCISTKQSHDIIHHAEQYKCCIAEAIIQLNILTSTVLSQQLGKQLNLPVVDDLQQYSLSPIAHTDELNSLILRHNILPIEESSTVLTIAIADPTNDQIEQELQFATGKQIHMVVADNTQLTALITARYNENSKSHISHEELSELVTLSEEELNVEHNQTSNTDPISRYINQILIEARRKKASDIHFEPYEKEYRIRFRCDGVLIETQSPALQLANRLSSKIKVLANLDIAEKRIPQDGRMKLAITPDKTIDIRVSTLPTLWGEKIVLRLLEAQSVQLDINALGLSESQKQLYLSAINKPQGLIIITGPTGSGKTISLYTGLNILNTPEKNISTAEDPVEINLSGINQVQINDKIDLSFISTLRALLRQDPDVIMIGEIRDAESAEIAIKASLTGHLVLSTLHTNSACETVIRLLNMGVDRYSLSSCLKLVVSQRLARKLCPHCKIPSELPINSAHKSVQYEPNPTGCSRCIGGYSGRTGIYELLEINKTIAQAIEEKVHLSKLEQLAEEQGFISLRASGTEKLMQGITSEAELQRTLLY